MTEPETKQRIRAGRREGVTDEGEKREDAAVGLFFVTAGRPTMPWRREIIMEHGMSADVSILASCRMVTDGVEAGA